MIEKKLQLHRYVPHTYIPYMKDYRDRLIEFLTSFNEYSVRRYAKKIIGEIMNIDKCIDKYYMGMEETFFNVTVKDFNIEDIPCEKEISPVESKGNPKRKKIKKKH